jgi:hypothetical protein
VIVGRFLVVCSAIATACSFDPGATTNPSALGDARGDTGSGSNPSHPSDAVNHATDSQRASDASVVDASPCGELSAPPATVTDMPTGAVLAMTSISLSGSGQVVYASPSAQLKLSLSFTLTDTRCGECVDQLEVGWMQGSSGPRSGCAWDGAVPRPGGVSPAVSDFAITAPSAVGAYDLRTNIGQGSDCGNGSWFASEVPAADTTIAKLCVQ